METLKFADNMICSRDGELFRVATAEYKHFTDDVVLNVTYKDKEEVVQMDTDTLYAGIYTVSNLDTS